MKTYVGFRNDEGAQAVIRLEDGTLETLDPRNDWRNHSPDGFEWGYHGSGPAQLALAIVGDIYQRDVAERVYQDFKRSVIATLYGEAWELTAAQVRETVDRIIGAMEARA